MLARQALKYTFKKHLRVRRWWLTPVILATQEAEIRRISIQSQPLINKFLRPYLEKKKKSQKSAGRVAQGADPEFKP
jgi:hypothetical protein